MRWHRGQRHALRASLILPVLVGCNDLEPGDREIIDRWLHCAECRSGERAAVRALGPRVVPALEKALKDGPPAEYLDNMRRKFDALYTSILTTSTPVPDSSSLPRPAYVERGVANYTATYQKRAATSLADIGGPDAADALEDAISASPTPFRRDVGDAIRAVRLVSDTAHFPGRVSPTAVSFGDTVTVQPPPTQPFDGDELAAVGGSPVPPSLMKVSGSTAAELKFLAAGFSGERRLTIRNVGTTTQSQDAGITILTMTDPNDRAMVGCSTLACRVNRAPRYTVLTDSVSHFFTLWRVPPSIDTLDIVKFEPPDSLYVTATLRWWPSTVDLNLRWKNCAMSADTGNTDGATSSHPEQTSVPIPGNRCWVLLVLLRASDKVPPVLAHLRLSR